MEQAALTLRRINPEYEIAQAPAPAQQQDDGKSFKDLLGGLVREVDGLQKTADTTVQDFASGEVADVHEVMLAMEKADLSFRFMMETRNKLVEAYREVMRMQV